MKNMMKTMTLMKKLFIIWTTKDSWPVIIMLTKYEEDKYTFGSIKLGYSFKKFKSWRNEDSFWQSSKTNLLMRFFQIYFRRVQIQTNLLFVQNDKFKERFQDRFQTSFIPKRLTRLKATKFLTRSLSSKHQDKFLQISTKFHFSSHQDYCSNTPVKLLLKLLFIYFSSSI